MRYEIDGITYVQKPLVLGQIRQLAEAVGGLEFSSPSPLDVIGVLGDKLPLAIAICITPEGQAVKDKDPAALAAEIEFSLGMETAVDIVSDFFDCNLTPSFGEKMSGMLDKIKGKIG